MNMTKLFAGVSAAALLAGAAFADDVTVNNVDATADGVSAGYQLAEELDVADAAPSTDLEFTVHPDSTTDWAGLGAAELTVTLTGAVFDQNIVAGNFSSGGTCSVTGVTNGAAGTSTATFSIADLADCDDSWVNGAYSTGTDDDDMEFDLPILVTDNDVNFTVAIERVSNGASIASITHDATTATTAIDNFIEATDAFDITIASDATTSSNDSVISLSDGYDSLINADNLTAGADVVGTVGLALTGNIDLASTAAANNAAQIDGIELTVTIPDATGIASVTMAEGGQDTDTVALDANNQAVFSLAAGDVTNDSTLGVADLIAGLTITLDADTDAATVISNTTISLSAGTDFDPAPDLVDESASGSLDGLARQGSNTPTFEWVGDSNASTANIFRATGMGSTVPVTRVTLEDSTNDMDGEYLVSPSGALNNGELIITTADIENAVGGAYGRADVSFSFEADGITVRRLMVTNGVVSENSTDYNVGTDQIGG